jgi:hypothetical protein
MYPFVRRDLASHRQLDHVHRRGCVTAQIIRFATAPTRGASWGRRLRLRSARDRSLVGRVTSLTASLRSIVGIDVQFCKPNDTLAKALQRYYFDENYHPLGQKQQAVVAECLKSLVLNQGPTGEETFEVLFGRPRKTAPKRRGKRSRRVAPPDDGRKGQCA